MAHFFGIAPGQEKVAPGLRVRVSEDGERVYIQGKWFDLGPDHAVIYIERGQRAAFRRADGKTLRLGDFPAWVCRGSARKHPPIAAMFNISQFEGGEISAR